MKDWTEKDFVRHIECRDCFAPSILVRKETLRSIEGERWTTSSWHGLPDWVTRGTSIGGSEYLCGNCWPIDPVLPTEWIPVVG